MDLVNIAWSGVIGIILAVGGAIWLWLVINSRKEG